MSTMVPRRAEQLLEALGADTDFREAVLGDLAEEYDLRASWDGPAVARGWYYRECLRVAPYLLRDWVRNLRWYKVGHIAVVVLGTSVFATVLEVVLRVLMVATDAAPYRLMIQSGIGFLLIPAFNLAWTMVNGVTGGYVAAWLGRRAPLPSALLMGTLGAGMLLSTGAPFWFKALNAATFFTGMLAGGVARTLFRARRLA